MGGQGVILATRILCNAAKESLTSEVHGMAQRGGAVISHVRIGPNIYSPTIPQGTADAILSLEPVETLRAIRFANSSTTIVMNITPVIPPAVTTVSAKYPSLDLVVKECRKFTRFICLVDGLTLAKEAGSPLTQNIVLLGALAATKVIPLTFTNFEKSIRELVPKRYLTDNLRAFKAGSRNVFYLPDPDSYT